MGHLSIHCHDCGFDWVVYHRDDWKDWKARTCPVCGKAIAPGTWDQQVLRAFGEMEDTNQELVKDHTQENNPLFTVSYIYDVPVPESDEVHQLIDQLHELRRDSDANTKVIVSILKRLPSYMGETL